MRKRSEHPLHKTRQHHEQLELAGLLAICVALLTQIFSMGAASPALAGAVYCFAVALPILALCLLVTTVPLLYEVTYGELHFGLASLGAELLAIVGIGCVFLHLSVGAAIAFSVSALVCVVLWDRTSESIALREAAESDVKERS